MGTLKMSNDIFIGIDTSCYTTSIAAISLDGKINISQRKILKVKKGKQGLRQSEAFFQHGENLVHLYELLLSEISPNNIKGVAVSSQPRNLTDSYMPVFLAGYQMAKTLSLTLDSPLFCYSHQEGHIMSSIYTSDLSIDKLGDFYSFHLSGGTTELLSCHLNNGRFDCEIIGGSLDISVGQLIDRVGVRMGLQFPCGKAIDNLACQSTYDKKYPISNKGLFFNLSGLESYGYKNIGNMSLEDQSKALINSITETLIKCLESLDADKPIIMTGGVSSNTVIRKKLKERFPQVYFGSKDLSTDNALGIALLGRWNKNEN